MDINKKKLPNATGISLKAEHYQTILDTKPNTSWFECHPENYMGDGGLSHYYLRKIGERYPISMHGVGLSLGSAEGLNQDHLIKLAKVVADFEPAQVSEHLAWSSWNKIYLNDLLPIPYTEECLTIVSSNIIEAQDTLKRNLLIENPSIYIGHNNNELSEIEFLKELVKRTDCGLLLDLNNVYVSAINQEYSYRDYIDQYPLDSIGEIHLAGHTEKKINDKTLLIDDHGSIVSDSVWELFDYTMSKTNRPLPVLIEWDTDIPDLSVLLGEASKAQKRMNDSISQASILQN